MCSFAFLSVGAARDSQERYRILMSHVACAAIVLVQDLLRRASIALIEALRGDAKNAPPPPLRGPIWVRDRCRRVLCHSCFHEKDETYRFCQNCSGEAPRGLPAVGNGSNLLVVNETPLRTRYDQFCSFQNENVGQRRKSAVADGFDMFVRSRSKGVSGWEDASPVMVVEWLCFLDSQGKGTTIVHATSCSLEGQYYLPCSDRSLGCTRRYAFGSLQKSFVSKLKRAYVKILGRFEEWSPRDMRGNSFTGAVINQYLAFATQEQLKAGVTPKQAIPILRPDLQKLMRDMHTCLLCAAQPADRLAYARDMVLFAIAFRTGSRGSDLAETLAAQVLHLPSSQVIVLNFQFTKTLRDGAPHASLLAPDKGMPETCAVAATTRYAQAADSCGWDMSAGYLFLEMSASGERIPKRLARPLSAKAMAARFKQHLEHAGLWARHFTFHSFRVGCAVSQTIAGKDIAEIMAAVNWKSEKVARRYVGGATNTREPTGTTPGAAEARYVTANDLAASLDPAVWTLLPPRAAPPREVSHPSAARATSSVSSQGNIPRA